MGGSWATSINQCEIRGRLHLPAGDPWTSAVNPWEIHGRPMGQQYIPMRNPWAAHESAIYANGRPMDDINNFTSTIDSKSTTYVRMHTEPTCGYNTIMSYDTRCTTFIIGQFVRTLTKRTE